MGPSSVIASLRINMGLDPSGVQKGTRQAEAELSRFQKVAKSTLGQGLLQGVGLGAGLGVTQAIAMGVSKAIDFTSDAITMASDLAETQSKLDVVFKDSAKSIREWSETSTAGIITTENELLAAAATLGNFAQGMGSGEAAAAAMSTRMVDLAADFASINNVAGGTNEVMGDFMSIMAGQTEVARRYAIDVGAAAIETQLLAKGVQKVNGAWSEAQKFQARTELIFDSRAAKVAAGDVERTATGFANASRTLDKTLAQWQTNLGTVLLPIASGVVASFMQMADAIETVSGLLPEATKAAQAFADSMQGMFKGTVFDRDWTNDAANGFRILATMGVSLGTDAPNKVRDAWDDLVAGRPIAETVRTWGEGLSDWRARLAAFGSMEVPAPAIADPLETEFDKAVKVIGEGFGNIKAALADPPQIISRDDRLENLAKRRSKVMRELHKAVAADDPLNIPHWTGAAAKIDRTIARLSGGTRTSMREVNRTLRTAAGKGTSETEKAAELTAAALPKALAAATPETGTAAAGMATAAKAPIAPLPGIFWRSGVSAGALYAAGLASQVERVTSAGILLAQAAAAPIETHSPPKVGPLRGISLWGPELVDLWVDPMMKKTRDVEKVGERLGRALQPKMRPLDHGGTPGWERASRAGVRALAGDGVGRAEHHHYHVGTLIANDAGLRDFERRREGAVRQTRRQRRRNRLAEG